MTITLINLNCRKAKTRMTSPIWRRKSSLIYS